MGSGEMGDGLVPNNGTTYLRFSESLSQEGLGWCHLVLRSPKWQEGRTRLPYGEGSMGGSGDAGVASGGCEAGSGTAGATASGTSSGVGATEGGSESGFTGWGLVASGGLGSAGGSASRARGAAGSVGRGEAGGVGVAEGVAAGGGGALRGTPRRLSGESLSAEQVFPKNNLSSGHVMELMPAR